jgi:hypothetical protein
MHSILITYAFKLAEVFWKVTRNTDEITYVGFALLFMKRRKMAEETFELLPIFL